MKELKKIFQLVENAYVNNQYLDYDEIFDGDRAYVECNGEKTYLFFTKEYVLLVEYRICLDDEEKDKGKWHKEYEALEMTKNYYHDVKDKGLEYIFMDIKKILK